MTKNAAENIARFVDGGGTFLTTYFSGVVDENERIHLGGYPALLRDVLGLWVEEWAPMPPGVTNRLEISGKPKHRAGGSVWSEVLHLTTAQALASFRDDFFAGRPAITRNHFGQGTAYYLATELEPDFLATILEGICDDLLICAPLKAPAGRGGLRADQRHGGISFSCSTTRANPSKYHSNAGRIRPTCSPANAT